MAAATDGDGDGGSGEGARRRRQWWRQQRWRRQQRQWRKRRCRWFLSSRRRRRVSMGQAVERSKEECMGSWHAGALCVVENGPQPPYANDTLQPVAASQPQWRARIARKRNPPTIPVSCSLASMALSSNIDPVNTPANREMHYQSLLIMCSSRWVLGALSRCRCCANNIHVLDASTLPSPWTWIMPRKSAAPRDARESCYWQRGGPTALRTSRRTTIISIIGPMLIDRFPRPDRTHRARHAGHDMAT